ncbi:unnamed protein product [Amoebophrya sp. A120]|nr:unnamed protein product [Amoebophrya sp. A120]|eukprot:GSA120T00022927001.1
MTGLGLSVQVCRGADDSHYAVFNEEILAQSMVGGFDVPEPPVTDGEEDAVGLLDHDSTSTTSSSARSEAATSVLYELRLELRQHGGVDEHELRHIKGRVVK